MTLVPCSVAGTNLVTFGWDIGDFSDARVGMAPLLMCRHLSRNVINVDGANDETNRKTRPRNPHLSKPAAGILLGQTRLRAARVSGRQEGICSCLPRCWTQTAIALTKWALKSEDIKRLQATIDLAKSEPTIPIAQEELDRDPWLLGVANGVVDLKTGKLREARREDYMTKVSAVMFDKTAKCPAWLGFLNDIFAKNKHLIAFLQRAIGYSLTGSTDERCVFILHGTGSNGKTTLQNVIGGIMGDYGMTCDPETLMVKRAGGIGNDIARLHGARFVATSETDKGQRIAEALIKRLSGNDKVTARFMWAEFFDFEPHFKIWMAANYKPVIHGTDYAIWQRLKLIPFSVTIPEEKRDAHLGEKLNGELPGILNWALKGCLAWQKQGLQEPSEVKAATQAYKQEMDSFGNWLSECCEVAPDKKAKASALYSSYKDYATTSGEQPLSQKEFSYTLQAKGYKREETKYGNVYIGLELASYGF